MIGDIIAGILALGFFGYVVFAIGKKIGAKGKFFADENDNDIPDALENKKKKK